MTDRLTQRRALEILGDPQAKETDWLGALSILGGKLPAVDRSMKVNRFLRRTAGLTLMYTALFCTTSLIDQIFFQQFTSYTLWYLLPIAFFWAVIEASTGFFTIYAIIALAACYWTSLMTLNPMVHCIWMIILLNMFSYAKFRWAPYVFVPITKVVRRQRLKTITQS